MQISHTGSGIALWIHVSPRSKRPSIGGVHDGALRVAVREPPVDGAANAGCVRTLAASIGVRQDQIDLDPASTRRRKRVRIAGDPEALSALIQRLASGPISQ